MSGITFDQLNAGQQLAFNSAIEAIENRSFITINGPAGTGKTTLTKFIIDWVVKSGIKGIILAAPTHQAKKVLSKLSGIEARTIHSVLKINPVTYEDTIEFSQNGEAEDLSDCSVLICDEVSMYDRKLFKILLDSIPYNCAIIGLGDISQIRPVSPGSAIPETSAFFFNEKFKQVSLSQVMRSNAPIIDVATKIRNGSWVSENLLDGNGVHNLSTTEAPIKEFFNQYFNHVKTPEDLFENRIYAFTNKSVDNINKIVRRRLYDTDLPFIKDEVIVMQEPVIKVTEFEGKKFSETLLNNGEYIKILTCFESPQVLKIPGYQFTSVVKCWTLNVRSLDTGTMALIKCFADEEQLNIYSGFLAKAAGDFKSSNQTKRPNWKGWWTLKNSFKKVKPLPCSTIHKSQGSSVDTAFVYTPCIHMTDSELAQQLLYVAVTRARHNVYYI